MHNRRTYLYLLGRYKPYRCLLLNFQNYYRIESPDEPDGSLLDVSAIGFLISLESDDVIPESVLPPIPGSVLTEDESTLSVFELLSVHEAIQNTIAIITIDCCMVFI